MRPKSEFALLRLASLRTDDPMSGTVPGLADNVAVCRWLIPMNAAEISTAAAASVNAKRYRGRAFRWMLGRSATRRGLRDGLAACRPWCNCCTRNSSPLPPTGLADGFGLE